MTGANQYKVQSVQNAHSTRTRDAIASRHGVDSVTIHRDAQFAQALDRVAEARQ